MAAPAPIHLVQGGIRPVGRASGPDLHQASPRRRCGFDIFALESETARRAPSRGMEGGGGGGVAGTAPGGRCCPRPPARCGGGLVETGDRRGWAFYSWGAGGFAASDLGWCVQVGPAALQVGLDPGRAYWVASGPGFQSREKDRGGARWAGREY